MIFIGIDVGLTGGIAMIRSDASVVLALPMPRTDRDIWNLLTKIHDTDVGRWACLEHVSSSPQMGVKSAFTFGGSYGALRMALTAAGIPFDEVKPFAWQRALRCLSGGDKNVTKQRAQQIFPQHQITHAIADALLIAEYARRVHHEPQAAQREAESLATAQTDDIDFNR